MPWQRGSYVRDPDRQQFRDCRHSGQAHQPERRCRLRDLPRRRELQRQGTAGRQRREVQRFGDESRKAHDLCKLGDKPVLGENWGLDAKGKPTKLRGTWQFVYDSTAAYGSTVFWKYNANFLKATGNKAYQ